MKISTKSRYALRMLLDLAQHQDEGFIALKDIAQRQNISKKYLEQIIPLLNRSDILQASRGNQGGYKLAKLPKEYTVGDILRITEGSISMIACLDMTPNTCENIENCMTLDVWKGLNDVVKEYLDSINLQDILDKHKDKSYIEFYI